MIKKILGILFSVILFCLTLVLLFRLYETFNPSFEKVSVDKLKYKTPGRSVTITRFPGSKKFYYELAFNGASNSFLRVIKTKPEGVAYDRTYVLNEYSLRLSKPINSQNANKHFIFGGCSFTFGEGLSDDGVLSNIVEEKVSEVDTYNLGFMGGSVGQLLFHFEKVNVPTYVKEKKGIFVYTFIKDHLNRWYLRPDYLHWAPKWYPSYAVKNNKVVFEGHLIDLPKFQNYRRLRKFGFEVTGLKVSSLFEPKDEFSEKEISDYILAVDELKRIYLALFPGSTFIFMFHPLSGLDPVTYTIIKSHLVKKGIKFLSPEDEFMKFREANHLKESDIEIPLDGHPTREVNLFIADYLIEQLKLK